MHSQYLSYLKILLKTERLAPDLLWQWQWRQLERMLRHAADETDLYPQRIVQAFPAGRFDPARWNDLPVLTRAEAQAAGPALWARNLPPEAGRSRSAETSGSTGMPLAFGWSDLASTSTRMQMERFWIWHGIDPARTFAEIRVLKQAEALAPDWQSPHRQGWSIQEDSGLAASLHVAAPIERQIAWLSALRPAYLLTYPSHAVALGQAWRQAGQMSGPETVITVGETLDPDQAARIAADLAGAKPARVLDSYGCQEAGKLALVCEAGRMHVCAENVHLEILDEDNQPVAPGMEGWVTITSLHNFVTPLIRYRLGDRALADDRGPCPCGRSLPVLGRILGRARNLLVLPDGRRFWPGNHLAAGMREFVRFRQFQLVQLAPDLCQLRYVPDPGAPPPDLAGLAAHAQRVLHPRMVIEPVAMTEITRSPSGKFEDYISLVP